ncbi:hypothetical protein, partial [Segatella bryantii]|uniref:hypothetical protein n=1 Tax=Segatella bryantii TaxID=77095 RepID=UPI00242D3455
KNFASLRSLREIYYINYSVACIFDATMLEKYLGQKNFSQSTQRRKDIKEYKAYKKTDYSVSRNKRYS